MNRTGKQNKIPHTDFALLTTIKSSTEKYRKNLKDIKLRKYKRDTEDYVRNEVYPWDYASTTKSRAMSDKARMHGTSMGLTRNRTRYMSAHGDGPCYSTGSDFTLGSDSSAYASVPFLDISLSLFIQVESVS